jgi:uncharacterized membrane protein
MKINDILLLLTATVLGLMAGVFFTYSNSVMPGLGKLSDEAFIKVMQSINREILNGLFFLCFFGVLVMLPLSTFLSYGNAPRFYLLLAATVVYFVGAFGVSVFGNIPLNNALDQFDVLHATKEGFAEWRAQFEERWNTLNAVRTVASLIALVLTLAGLVVKGKSSV